MSVMCHILLALCCVVPLCGWAEIPFLKRYPLHYQKVEGGSGYSLQTEHLPRNEPMLLMTRRLNGTPFAEVQELYTNQNGDLVTDLGSNILFNMPLEQVGLAEPIEFIVVPKKQYENRQKRRPIIAISPIIPHPIEAKDSNGHSLTMHIASPDAMYFSVKATGFQPRERLQAVVTTDRGEVALRGRATKEGTFVATIAPAPIGMREGSFTFELRAPSVDQLIVGHQWGAAALRQ